LSARTHVTAGAWIRGIVFLATVALVGAGVFLGLGLLFGLVFNQYTINPIFFVVGWLVFRYGFTEYRSRLSVTGTATAKANSAAIGLVELSGRAYAANPSEAPVTKTQCAFWRVVVQHKGDKSFRWAEWTWNDVMKRSSGLLDGLVLQDETGQVPVWPRDAEVIPVRQVWRSTQGDAPDDVKQFFGKLGLEWPSKWSRSPVKITEERIEQGGPLYVMGTLAERRQIPATKQGWFTTLLDRWAPSSPEAPPENVQSFSGTFSYARKVGLRWFAKDLRPLAPAWLPPEMNPHDVLVWKGDQGRPFIVSGVLEPQALRALSRRAWLFLFGGAGLMVLMLWQFLEKLTGGMPWSR
jgi:hypothetical protein